MCEVKENNGAVVKKMPFYMMKNGKYWMIAKNMTDAHYGERQAQFIVS